VKRRINFTDRKGIPLDRVSLNLLEHDGGRTFDVKLDLDELGLPQHAAIYVEAYHKTDYMRYSFGMVGRFSRPESTDLGSLGRIENLHFRVKIVDESGRRGLILAEVDRIRVQAPAQLRPILPVEFRDDLGNQVWRLSFDGDEPVLELNSAIPFIRDKAKTDYRLFFYIYPAVLREILIHMVLLDGIPDVEDAEEWEENWLEFATHYGGDPPEVLDSHSSGFDEVQVRRWIETVVTEFCTSHADKWGNFIQLEEGET
jgi:hypothetical protein